MLNKHPFLGVFLIFLGFKFLSIKIITRISVLFMYIYIYFCDEFKPQCSHSPCCVMKHFRNGYRVCINCFSHVVANTFSGNFRYFIVIHFISYKII
ncbi:unknown (plasmid) [Escherichia coli O157:H7 str. EDL933]|uniref:Uncharacterized protein n=1 Tax=Escherichia coli O157:H7 TaxID=83334 RepID=Q9ZGV4_ECO57|nr:unknown [Escherichia coli O157:H7 str. EDL933]ACT75247.1 hypothetical protein ECSP_6087 [Escherichia coli O157:H7 str. TW14359]